MPDRYCITFEPKLIFTNPHPHHPKLASQIFEGGWPPWARLLLGQRLYDYSFKSLYFTRICNCLQLGNGRKCRCNLLFEVNQAGQFWHDFVKFWFWCTHQYFVCIVLDNSTVVFLFRLLLRHMSHLWFFNHKHNLVRNLSLGWSKSS